MSQTFRITNAPLCKQLYMSDLKEGQVAVIEDSSSAENGKVIVICPNDFAQILGERNGWTGASYVDLKVKLLTSGDSIMVGDKI